MRDRITTISIKKLEASNILYQHDTGQIIKFVEEIQNDSLVLFENHNVQLKAEPQYVRDNHVEVPNKLLTAEGNLIVTIKLVDENSETTQRVVKIKIKRGADIDGKIPEENQKTFIQQIQETMDSAKQIAQSIRDDADDGKFKGDTGPIGPKGEQGENYNLTEEDKEEISESAKEKVVEEIQLDLDNKVPKTRTVVGKKLESDISILDIVNAIYDNTGKNPISDFENLLTISKVIKDIKAVVDEKASKQYVDAKNENKAKRYTLEGSNEPTTNANEYLGVELGDICVNESYRAWICQYLYGNTVVWSELITPTSPYLAGNYYTKNLIDNMLKEKTDKNEWQLFNTYEANGETGGFEYTSASGIKTKEIRVVGYGLTFSAASNINLGFRTSKNPYSSGHKQLVFGNGVVKDATYQLEGLIKRIGEDKILVSMELWAERSVATTNVLKRQHIFTDREIIEGKNIVYLCSTVSSGNKINSGIIETYTRGRY